MFNKLNNDNCSDDLKKEIHNAEIIDKYLINRNMYNSKYNDFKTHQIQFFRYLLSLSNEEIKKKYLKILPVGSVIFH